MGKIKLILDSMSLIDLMPDRLDADVLFQNTIAEKKVIPKSTRL
jgi:hypothetical protein